MNSPNVNQTDRVRRNSAVIQAVIPNQEDLELIKKAAAMHGSAVSGFVRAATLRAAKQVLDAESMSAS